MEQDPEIRHQIDKIVKDVLPDSRTMPVEEAMKLVRAEVYRRLKRLEAAEGLLREARATTGWPDLEDRIAEFLKDDGNG